MATWLEEIAPGMYIVRRDHPLPPMTEERLRQMFPKFPDSMIRRLMEMENQRQANIARQNP